MFPSQRLSSLNGSLWGKHQDQWSSIVNVVLMGGAGSQNLALGLSLPVVSNKEICKQMCNFSLIAFSSLESRCLCSG